ncbi:GNAT family N-acetyltransferase [Algoriphagus boritolerans]|uniref:GNAT family N-acetyltransferase n=1 Tax=Algoriphagus boritolerans TaxID=308111 RepID=UPI002FCE6847
MNVTHSVKAFQDLTVYELYALLKLRSEVFVVEQNCVYLDLDDKDQVCYHVMLYRNDQLVACSRLVPPGLVYEEMAIGRVISAGAVRGLGMGRKVMGLSIQYCQELFGPGDIRIGAQTYALGFYSSLGFVPDGETYDEDGIEHIEMVKKISKKLSRSKMSILDLLHSLFFSDFPRPIVPVQLCLHWESSGLRSPSHFLDLHKSCWCLHRYA